MRTIVILFLGLAFLATANALAMDGRACLTALLPAESELPGWSLAHPPETAEGVELFSLINGGAELYVRAGFERALMATYSEEGGRAINLDIFEMKTRVAAESVQRQKAGETGTVLSIGDAAVLNDYYLNVLAGRFQITLSGYDSDKTTVRMLREMAEKVVKRIRVMEARSAVTCS